MSGSPPGGLPKRVRWLLALQTLFALGVVTLLVFLGVWQLERDTARNQDWHAAQRDDTYPALGASALAGTADRIMWRRVQITAVFSGEPMLLSGANESHRPGFRVMQVGTTETGDRILVDRGFLAHAGVEGAVTAFAPDESPVLITGRVRPLTGSPDARPYPRKRGCATVWPPHSRASMAATDWYIQTGEARVEYDWTSLHYAIQWFGMAALGLMGWAGWIWQRLGYGFPWTTEPEAQERPSAHNLNP